MARWLLSLLGETSPAILGSCYSGVADRLRPVGGKTAGIEFARSLNGCDRVIVLVKPEPCLDRLELKETTYELSFSTMFSCDSR